MEFKNYKMEDIATFSQGKQVEIENQYTEKKENMKRFLRIIDFTNPNEPIRYVENFGDRYYAKKDDLVMIRYGSQTCGKVVIGKEGIIANNMFKINLDNSIVLNRYAYYYLKQDIVYNYLRGSQNSSTMPSINFGILNKLEIEVPSIDNQRKIVKILNDIDKKIELNNEINNNLYEMGDILYNEYFGKYKDNLPSDYNIVKLNEVADNFDSKRKPMSSREREQHRGIYPYYGATSIIDYVDDYIFDDTYLLMGEDGTVKTDDGYPVLQYIWGKNWINNHAHVLKGKNISTELLMFALRKINIENIITGAVQPKINQENMNKIEFVIGSDSKNKELEDILKKLMDKSKNIIEENKRLEELRDTLLPKLMNGEIDLDKIEL